MNPIVGGLSEMVNFRGAGVLVAIQEFLQFTAVSMNVSEVEGPKVFIERRIPQLVVNVEEEGVLDVLGGLGVRDPIQFV